MLTSESTIWLFGREATDITLAKAKGTGAAKQQLARIYGFAYHNEYFELGSPSLFVVAGQGTPLKNTADVTGLGVIPQLAQDLRVWEHDIDDLSVRLDVMAGRFSRILLDVELQEEGLQDFVRGTAGLGLPSSLGPRGRRRSRRWKSDDD